MLDLTRTSKSRYGTFGELYNDDLFICNTLERLWLNNEDNISCIPKGVYKVVPYSSAKFPNTFHLLNVPDREAILIHKGNTIVDTQGCILVGLATNNKGLAQSKLALDKLLRMYPEGFTLQIGEDYGS